MSFLHRSDANHLCIFPALVYVLPKWALWFNFCEGYKVCVQIPFFTCTCPIFPALLVAVMIFTPWCWFCFFVTDQLTKLMWVSLGALYSSPVISLLFYQHTVLITAVLYQILRLGNVSPLALFSPDAEEWSK